MEFQHSKMRFQHSKMEFQHSKMRFQHSKKNENNNKKIIRSLQNTTKKTRTNARRKLKEEEDLNDKLTNKLQECRAQRLSKKVAQRERRSGRRSVEKKCRTPRLSKNKSEKKEVSSHKGGVALYTS